VYVCVKAKLTLVRFFFQFLFFAPFPYLIITIWLDHRSFEVSKYKKWIRNNAYHQDTQVLFSLKNAKHKGSFF